MRKGLWMTAESGSRTKRSGIPLKDYYGADEGVLAGRDEAPGQFPFMLGRRDRAPRTGSCFQTWADDRPYGKHRVNKRGRT